MILLAIDTALDACAAALARDDADAPILARESETIGRGHAEKLMAVVDAALLRAGVALTEVDAFAVSIGPGSFTGIRVGVAAVRGFAVATGRPAIGVSSLEALAAEARATAPGRPVLALLDARKDEVYAQPFAADGSALAEPVVIAPARAAEIARRHGAGLVGSGAALVAAFAPECPVLGEQAFPDVVTLARLALARLAEGETPMAPAPLYVRPADAKPQAHARLARLTPGSIGGGAP